MKYFFILLCLITFVSSCDSSKTTVTDEQQFEGKWKLSERGILDGIEIEIKKDSKGHYSGIIKKLNNNKYVKMFMEEGDIFLSGIKRNSNFEFVISEKKIAAPLFSAYGQSTTEEFVSVFAGKNKVLLGRNGSSGAYLRLKNE